VAQLTVAGTPAAQTIKTTPWPNDLFRDDAGHVILSQLAGSDTEITPLLKKDLAEVEDGFGVISGAFFPVSAAIDPATLDGNVHLYDLADGSEIPIITHYRQHDLVIYARPVNGEVLLERHVYAYVVTNKVKGTTGALRPSSDLSAILAAHAVPSGVLSRAYTVYRPLLDLLDRSTGITRSNVAGATVFTTHSITSILAQARAALDGAPPPQLAVSLIFAKTKAAGDAGSLDDLLGTPVSATPGLDNAGGVVHDKIGYVVQGTLTGPDYLDNTTTLNAFGATPTTAAAIDVSGGKPVPRGTVVIPFTLVLPDVPSLSSVPVAIYQHGLGGSRAEIMGLANTLAGLGVATLGVDIPFHGGRNTKAVDQLFRYTGQKGADGWAEVSDNPAYVFFDTLGDSVTPALWPAAIRSAFIQAALDVMQATRVITVGDVSALGQKDARLVGLGLRHDAVVYTSESFGSMIGSVYLAVEPNVGAAVLDVGGGGLIFPLLINSAVFGPVFGSLLDGALGTSTSDPADPADTDFGYNLLNALLEPGDALANSPYVQRHPLEGRAPKHLLQTSAHLDEVVPNPANEALARGLGLQPVDLVGQAVDLAYWPMGHSVPAPVSANVTAPGGPVTGAFIQFEPATHPMLTEQRDDRNYDLSNGPPFRKAATPVQVDNPIGRLQGIIATFVGDFYAGKVPRVTEAP
jgi:hypothetical protein